MKEMICIYKSEDSEDLDKHDRSARKPPKTLVLVKGKLKTTLFYHLGFLQFDQFIAVQFGIEIRLKRLFNCQSGLRVMESQ